MPPTSILINTMPGTIVDEYATIVTTTKQQYPPLAGTENSHVIEHGATCPCCQRARHDDEGRETLNEPAVWSRRESYHQFQERQKAAQQSAAAVPSKKQSSAYFDEERDSQPGVLDSGVEYKPKRVLAEGIINKKGTGRDWFGSRSWKPRYCRLVLAKVQGFVEDVPLLLVYWFHSSDTPSTVISLDSTVVVPLDQPDDEFAEYIFNIVYAKDEKKTTRTFTVPRKGRDAWVSAINQAVYNYEKEKSKRKKMEANAAKTLKQALAAAKKKKPTLRTPGIWSSDDVVEMTVVQSSPRSVLCLPLSPRSPHKKRCPIVAAAPVRPKQQNIFPPTEVHIVTDELNALLAGESDLFLEDPDDFVLESSDLALPAMDDDFHLPKMDNLVLDDPDDDLRLDPDDEEEEADDDLMGECFL